MYAVRSIHAAANGRTSQTTATTLALAAHVSQKSQHYKQSDNRKGLTDDGAFTA
jgi:hypothetical protein